MRTLPCGLNTAARRAESRAAFLKNAKYAAISAIGLIVGAAEFFALLALGGAA